ncbi:MAG: glycosyltransferase family 39 protein [Candidatus Krumholzibacteriota bacterium]|nr:glycosyltransferase family 39 protein [Candidatus Krumholzibacteriota bacterium]
MARRRETGLFVDEGFLALVVVLVALVIRLLHAWFTAKYNPLAADLVLDAAGYDRWARVLVWGGELPATRLMQAPLYPWFVSIVYRIFGPSPTAVRVVQAILGTASVGFTVTIARRLLGSSAAGILAGLLMACYLPLVFYEGVLVPATLVVFLNLLFVLLLTTESGPPPRVRLLAAGLVLGFSVVAKPVALLLLPFALLHLRFGGGGPGNVNARSEAPRRPGRGLSARAAVFAAGLVFGASPLAIRNLAVTGDFIPLTTGGGINFYIGNNAGANGFYAVPDWDGRSLGATPGEQCERMYEVAAAVTGRPVSHAEMSNFWRDRGLDWARGNPGAWAALAWQKTLFFWNRYERANVESIAFHRRFPGIVAARLPGWGVAAPLAILGIFLTAGRWRRLWLLYGLVGAYFAAAVIFYVLARYRLPAVPALAAFAGAAVTELLRMIRDRRRAEFVLMIAAFVLCAFFVNRTVARDTPGLEAGGLVRLGTVFARRGDTAGAEAAWREALLVDPSNEAARQALERLGR